MSAEPSDDTTNTMSSTETEPDAEPSDGSTTSPSRRHWLTNDAIAIGLVGSMIFGVLLGGVGWLNLQTVPGEIIRVYSLSVGVAIIWAFGADAVEAWRGGK